MMSVSRQDLVHNHCMHALSLHSILSEASDSVLNSVLWFTQWLWVKQTFETEQKVAFENLLLNCRLVMNCPWGEISIPHKLGFSEITPPQLLLTSKVQILNLMLINLFNIKFLFCL